MKTTRRQFIKSLLATAATAAIAPQVLVESVHGASDLTAHERDVVANALGLMPKQWRGDSPSSPSPWSARVVNAKEGEIVVSYEPDALCYALVDGHVNCRCWTGRDLVALERFAEDTAQQNVHAGTGLHLDDAVHYGTEWITPTPRRVQVPVLVPGDSLFSAVELDVSDQEPLTAERVQSAFVRLCAERAVERDQQILLGRPGGQMPVGVLSADEQATHVEFTGSETAFSYITYPVLGADIDGNAGYGQITLPKDTPEEEVRAELEAAGRRLFDSPFRSTWADEEKPAMLYGRPVESRGGYLVPREYQDEIERLLCGDNLYDNEPKII